MKDNIVRKWKIAALTATILLTFVVVAQAEIRPGTLSVTPFAGGFTFDGTQHLETGAVFGLRVGYDFTERFGLESVFDYVLTKGSRNNNDTDFFSGRLEGLFYVFPYSRLVPYLTLGFGGMALKPEGQSLDSNALFDCGLGFKYFLTDSIALRGDARQLFVLERSNSPKYNWEYTAGLTFLLGGKQAAAVAMRVEPPAPVPQPSPVAAPAPAPPVDSDGDGVIDDLDKCPNTPMGVRVDNVGCPLDTDKDGVPDYLDKCPDTPADVKVDKDGCDLPAMAAAAEPTRYNEISVSAREYLLKGQSEDPNYGLWSYFLLFRKPANDGETERSRAFLRAYRSGMSPAREIVRDLQPSVVREKAPGEDKNKVNITYWPLNVHTLPPETDEDFFIDNYGLIFARLVRDKAKLGKRVKLPGPFIIASRVPLSGNRPPRKGELLIIDLSRLDETHFVDIVDLFQRRVLDNADTWQRRFDWELIRIHFKSATKIQGTPILHSFGRIFEVREAAAAKTPAKKPKKLKKVRTGTHSKIDEDAICSVRSKQS